MALFSTRPHRLAKYAWNTNSDISNAVFVGAGLMNLTMGACLDIINGLSVDFLADLRSRKLYRHAVKHRYGIYFEAYNKVWRIIQANAESSRGGAQIYADFLDCAQDDVRADVLKLYYPVKQVLLRHNIPNADLLAQSEVIRIMLSLAMRTFNTLAESLNRHAGCQVSAVFCEMNPKGIAQSFDALHAQIAPYNISDTEHLIADDDNVALAVKIIWNKINNLSNVSKNCKAAKDIAGITDEEDEKTA